MSDLNVGRRVRWTTYPSAGVGRHEGVIVAHVPAGDDMGDVAPEHGATAAFRGFKDTVAFDRYLVREDRRGIDVRGDGGRVLAPRWYAPRVSAVEVL